MASLHELLAVGDELAQLKPLGLPPAIKSSLERAQTHWRSVRAEVANELDVYKESALYKDSYLFAAEELRRCRLILEDTHRTLSNWLAFGIFAQDSHAKAKAEELVAAIHWTNLGGARHLSDEAGA